MKFSILLKEILFEEESIFSSLKNDIENINLEFKKFDKKDIPDEFIAQWEHYLKLMNSNIDKKEIDKLIENIKGLKGSYLSNWVLPHQKLEKIINHKNILLTNLLNKISIIKDNYMFRDKYDFLPIERSNYLSNLYEEIDNPSIIDEINNIIDKLKNYNNQKMVNEFIDFWEQSKIDIKNIIDNNKIKGEDIRKIQNILHEITESLNFYFSIPHRQLQDLLNILNLQDKYIYFFVKTKDRS